MAENKEPKKVEVEVETEGQETEFTTEFNAAEEQKAAPMEQKKRGRPDKIDDRGNHR